MGGGYAGFVALPRGYGRHKPGGGLQIRIDSGHALGAGLAWSSRLAEFGGVTTRDDVRFIAGTLTGMTNGGTWGGGSREIGWPVVFGNGQTAYIDWGAAAELANLFADPGGTVISWHYSSADGFNSTEGARILEKSTGTTPGAGGWSLYHQTSNHRIHFRHGWSTQAGEWRTGNNSAPKHVMHCVVCSYNKDGGTAAPSIWINGVPQTLTTVLTPSGTPADDSSVILRTHSRAGNGGNLVGAIAFQQAFRGRMFTDGDALLAWLEPFGAYVQHVPFAVITPATGQTPVSQTFAVPWESLQRATATNAAAWESLQRAAIGAPIAWETVARVVAGISAPWDSIAGTIAAFAVSWEALQRATAAAAVPFEAAGGVAAAAALPWETLRRFAAELVGRYETIGAVAVVAGVPYETIAGIRGTMAPSYETLQRAAVAAGLPWETVGAIEVLAVLPFETTNASGGITRPGVVVADGVLGGRPLLALAGRRGLVLGRRRLH